MRLPHLVAAFPVAPELPAPRRRSVTLPPLGSQGRSGRLVETWKRLRRSATSLACAVIWATACGGPGDGGPPLVLLVSIDTLRADALGTYGSARDTTPRLDAWSARATVFESVTAPSPWTIPSHASLLTSLDPGVTGADFTNPVPPELPVLAELFRQAGYATGAVVNTSYLGEEHGFARGFDEFQSIATVWTLSSKGRMI